MKKIGAELMLVGFTLTAGFFTWIVVSIYSVQAKADRVVAIEAKMDYVYNYLIEHPKNGDKK